MTAIPHDYAERVYAGVLGKLIGVYLGRPFEGWTYERILKELGPINYYVHDRHDVALRNHQLVVTDDDIAGTFAFPRALADNDYPRHLTAEQVGQAWLNYVVEEKSIFWWGGIGSSTEHTAFLRLKSGIPAPRSGSIELNGRTVAEQIGAQIFIDGWRWSVPATPSRRPNLAEQAARVSHDGEAVHAAKLLAAMEAEAFVEDDVDKLLGVGLDFVPADSLIRRVVEDVRDWHAGDERARLAAYPGADRRALRLRQVRRQLPCHPQPRAHHPGAALWPEFLPGDDAYREHRGLGHRLQRRQHRLPVRHQERIGRSRCRAGLAHAGCGPDVHLLGRRRCFGHRCGDRDPGAGRRRLQAGRRGCARGTEGRGALPLLLPRQPAGLRLRGRRAGDAASAVRGKRGRSQPPRRAQPRPRLPSDLAPGRVARVSSPTFFGKDGLTMPTYQMVACPTLYPGQTVECGLAADVLGGGTVSVRLYASVFAAGDTLVKIHGEPRIVGTQSDVTLKWRIPDTGGYPIFDIGLEIEAHDFQGVDGTLYLDWLHWDGAPTLTFRRPDPSSEMWKHAWVNDASQFQTRWEGLRVTSSVGQGFIAQGTRDWQDYEVATTMTPLLAEAWGLAARVQGRERYYALVFDRAEGGRVRLVRRRHDETVLAEQAFPWSLDRAYALALRVDGSTISASIDGNTVFDVQDSGATH